MARILSTATARIESLPCPAFCHFHAPDFALSIPGRRKPSSPGLLFAFPRQQPLNRFAELSTNRKQNLRANLDFPAFHTRKIALTYPDPFCKFLLFHIETAQFPNSPSYRFPINCPPPAKILS